MIDAGQRDVRRPVPTSGGASPRTTTREQVVDESRPPESARKRFLRRLRRQRIAMAAIVFLVLVILVAIFAPAIAPYDPDENDLRGVFAPPSSEHWLGTDQNGRDTLSRLIYGARVSLLAAGQAVAIALLIGTIPGLLAGYFGGKVDAVIMRIAEAIMTFPPLLLAMAIVGVLGPGLRKAMFAVGLVFAPRFARLDPRPRAGRAGGDLHRGLPLDRDVDAAHPPASRAAQHPVPADRADLARPRVLDAGRGGAVVPRPRRDPAPVELGLDAAERLSQPQHRASSRRSRPAWRSCSRCSRST